LIGAGLLHASRVHITRHQILLDVAAEVKETVNFVIPQETGMHYLDRVETDWPFRIQMPRGFNVPFHCTASGKTFMASLSKSAREKFIAGLSLKEHTQNTHTTADSLLKNLKQNAKRGFALDEEEFVEGMVAAAVPVTDHKGRFVAALAVHGPKQRLSLAQATACVDCLHSAADRLRHAIFT
jgi:DNA-binding IclR family transcriptional regulator